MEKLHEKIWIRTIKNRFWERCDSIEKETEQRELRKITTKKGNVTGRLEAEIKEVEEIKIEAIEYKGLKLLDGLNLEKGIEVDEIIEAEIRLEKLKRSEATTNAIKKSIIANKYLHLIS